MPRAPAAVGVIVALALAASCSDGGTHHAVGGRPDGQGALVPVALEDFFEGNHDAGSIGPNLFEHPGPQRIYRSLRGLRAHADVLAVVVLVREDRPGFAEAVQIVTTARTRDVDAVTTRVGAGPSFDVPWAAAPFRLVTVWWP